MKQSHSMIIKYIYISPSKESPKPQIIGSRQSLLESLSTCIPCYKYSPLGIPSGYLNGLCPVRASLKWELVQSRIYEKTLNQRSEHLSFLGL